MQLKTILNAVEKYKYFVYSDARWVKSRRAREIEFVVQPRKSSKPICSGCGKKRPGYDRLAARQFDFVPLWAIPVFLVYTLRRVQCPQCGVVVEKVPWASGKNHQANTYRVFLVRWGEAWQEHVSTQLKGGVPAACAVVSSEKPSSKNQKAPNKPA